MRLVILSSMHAKALRRSEAVAVAIGLRQLLRREGAETLQDAFAAADFETNSRNVAVIETGRG